MDNSTERQSSSPTPIRFESSAQAYYRSLSQNTSNTPSLNSAGGMTPVSSGGPALPNNGAGSEKEKESLSDSGAGRSSNERNDPVASFWDSAEWTTHVADMQKHYPASMWKPAKVEDEAIMDDHQSIYPDRFGRADDVLYAIEKRRLADPFEEPKKQQQQQTKRAKRTR